jgi:proteasome lid subunit RPN8/RPN11
VKAPNIGVHVSEEALADVRERASDALPHETGGIVLGCLTATGVWITRFAEVPSKSPHLTRFLIPAGSTHRIVDEAHAADARVGYLGDWHTHPADTGASNVDLATLQDLAVGVFRRRRLLAILRRVDRDWALDLWVLNRLRRPIRLEYEMAGPLPGPNGELDPHLRG